MLIKLTGGTVYDPMHGVNGQVRDVCVRDGRIVPSPRADERVDEEYDLRGKVVMAGAIDPHSHIGGGKVNIARTLLPEDHRPSPIPRTALTRSGTGRAAPSTITTGYRYAEMGYTAVFEPAMLPANSRQAHMEMADTPIIDKGAYVMLGSDDYLLRMMAAGKSQEEINQYIAYTIVAAQALAVKVVNPGGISAFKFNQRNLDLDEKNSYYGVTPRQILQTLARGVKELGVPHPLHIHGCNLGVPGNMQTTLDTMSGVEGLPIHLTHIQFHSYGTEGDKKFSSGAAQIAEAINRHKHVSADVGQIMFGQTVTASGDNMAQFRNRSFATPNKWVCMDIECDAGCGVVPFRYRDQNFVNALQWAIGLEIFLLVEDPWRVFLTTDHPNGAPFTSYPHLIRLLMDKSFRDASFERLHPEAQAMSTLKSIQREYSLYEIAIMTRAAPSRSLGLSDRGHLGEGAAADITVYTPHGDKERMFEKPDYVFKDGTLVAKNGKIVKVTDGGTHTLRPGFDKAALKPLRAYFEQFHTVRLENFRVSDEEIVNEGRGRIIVNQLRAGSRG
jgi:formylmethanofuran dehydrogenase subunit A